MRRLVLRLLVAMLATFGMVVLTAASSSAQDQLVLTVSVTDATVDPTTGLATIYFTVTCSEDAIINGVTSSLSQRDVTSGLAFIRGWSCSPSEPAVLTTFTSSGQLRPGPATLHLYVAACAYDYELQTCTSQATLQTETAVRLQPSSVGG